MHCPPGRPALDLVRDSVLVLSNLDGTYRHPERFSRPFAGQVAQARKAVGEERLPAIRLQDLRHTHATLLLTAGVPVKGRRMAGCEARSTTRMSRSPDRRPISTWVTRGRTDRGS